MPEARQVERMFAAIASRYDRANHLLSGGFDFSWRRKLAVEVSSYDPETVVDLATGSGDVAFALARKLDPRVRITGIDFCRAMLERAESKRKRLPFAAGIEFRHGDCLDLPLEDDSVDAVTIAFGIRNFEDRPKGLGEIRRILRKPRGVLFILEFSQPAHWIRPIYYAYLRHLLPKVAGLATRRSDAYKYLVGSISRFPTREEFSGEISREGFPSVSASGLTLGIVALHRAAVG